MPLDIDINQAIKMLEDFYIISKMNMSIFDEDANFIFTYPPNMSKLCSISRMNPVLCSRCNASDEEGFEICKKTKKMYKYYCHMGLVEVIVPILEDGILIGFMKFGQICDSEDKSKIYKIIKGINNEFGLDINILNDAVEKLNVVTEDKISAYADIMEICASYLWLKKMIRSQSSGHAFRVSNYIEQNLMNNLSVENICAALHISKSTLYNISKANFSMGISDYITAKRLEKAKSLLKNSDMPINEIAAHVGIFDANYFTKVFKKNEGMVPKEYRK